MECQTGAGLALLQGCTKREEVERLIEWGDRSYVGTGGYDETYVSRGEDPEDLKAEDAKSVEAYWRLGRQRSSSAYVYLFTAGGKWVMRGAGKGTKTVERVLGIRTRDVIEEDLANAKQTVSKLEDELAAL